VGELTKFEHEHPDLTAVATTIRTNFEGPAQLIAAFAARFAERGRGVIVGVSSVAGDRGRGSNVVYGSAKAGLTAFLSGMRNLMAPIGPRIVTVKPGFVRTRMTAGMKLPSALTAEPEEVANAIFMAAEVKHRDIVYVRRIWRPIMLVIRLIPEAVFKKLKL
jgi:NAD(P)-dependent dehydrogenase (short-subunit alcohol dehydrogenase family)